MIEGKSRSVRYLDFRFMLRLAGVSHYVVNDKTARTSHAGTEYNDCLERAENVITHLVGGKCSNPAIWFPETNARTVSIAV